VAWEAWSRSQSLCAVFSVPGLDAGTRESFREGLRVPFAPGTPIERKGVKYGWLAHADYPYTQLEPALWTAAALAVALRQPDLPPESRREYLGWYEYVQEVVRTYRPEPVRGGWNAFPRQRDPSDHNPYTTTLALLALLEARRSDLPWEGSAARRDERLRATAGWLIARFDPAGDPPGWRGVGESAEDV